MLQKRFLSLWFPCLGVERILRSESVLNDKPFATVTKKNNSLILSSVSCLAEKKRLVDWSIAN